MAGWLEVEAADVRLWLESSSTGLKSVRFEAPEDGFHRSESDPVLAESERQLRAYFAGDLREFSVPLDMQGTEFQKQIWRELIKIPYGETRSYMDIAEAIGSPGAVRAVGAANGANPIAIIVPCHRVIGSGGKLVGYGGGLALKKRLLDLEARVSGRRLF